MEQDAPEEFKRPSYKPEDIPTIFVRKYVHFVFHKLPICRARATDKPVETHCLKKLMGGTCHAFGDPTDMVEDDLIPSNQDIWADCWFDKREFGFLPERIN
ncbi:hypothetical protein BDN67DRAFT_1017017 [Paxillus ammoniavirescens]|nr:hypothetical protein BDN67DRAFT_1017017 [Paxillus ammoniavirescens]